MTTDWKVGDRGRIGDAEFEVTVSDRYDVTVQWGSPENSFAANAFRHSVLAAMGAVRIRPPAPPTIGTPQSVKDNPPHPMNTIHYHYVFVASSSNGFDSSRLESGGAVAVIRHRHEVTAAEMEAENPQAHNHTLKTGGPYFPAHDPLDTFLPVLDLDGTA